MTFDRQIRNRRIGFPVYGRAVVPVTARRRLVQESSNAPIQCAGVSVHPGDLVIADGSGTVFVPRQRAKQIIQTAERLAAREQTMVQAVRSGRSVVEVMHDAAFDAALKEGS